MVHGRYVFDLNRVRLSGRLIEKWAVALQYAYGLRQWQLIVQR